MGILNVTPDSFSDGGSYIDVEAAVQHAVEMYESGADIIDIGGMSTRPGHTVISPEEELRRVLPVLEALCCDHPEIPVSIDTYRSSVAAAAVECGACLINDITGLMGDADMARLIADTGVMCCIMHNRLGEEPYQDFGSDIMADLSLSIEHAKECDIKDNQIILDPGVGFAKTTEQNLWVLRNLKSFETLGYPLLLGASRKSYIKQTLGYEDTCSRDDATLTTSLLAAEAGYAYVRVHNVERTMHVLNMYYAIYQA